jgi:hypothetical protein
MTLDNVPTDENSKPVSLPLQQLSRNDNLRSVKTAPLDSTEPFQASENQPTTICYSQKTKPLNRTPLASVNTSKSESSCFEIETLSEESPFEYQQQFDHNLLHSPPHDCIEEPAKLKTSVRYNRSYTDHFNRTVEDRFLQWNTSISQYNIDPVVNGKHPFMKEALETSKDFVSLSMFDSFRNWFNSDNPECAGPCPPSKPHSTKGIDPTKSGTLDNDEIIDNVNMLSNMKLKPNSSKSFVTSKQLTDTNLAHICQFQPTPVAYPVYDFNFEKPSKQFEIYEPENSGSHLTDNFVFDCFNQCWKSSNWLISGLL